MARHTTLQVLLDDVRSEAGHAISTNLGQATHDMLIKLSEQFNTHDSDQNIKSWPIENYDSYYSSTSVQQIEVWPIPSQAGSSTTGEGTLRLEGIRKLSPLIALSDTADLDDQLIVLHAAGELLQRQKSADAQLKLAQAQAHYARLKARLSKTESIVLGDEEPDLYKPRGPIVIHRTT